MVRVRLAAARWVRFDFRRAGAVDRDLVFAVFFGVRLRLAAFFLEAGLDFVDFLLFFLLAMVAV